MPDYFSKWQRAVGFACPVLGAGCAHEHWLLPSELPIRIPFCRDATSTPALEILPVLETSEPSAAD